MVKARISPEDGMEKNIIGLDKEKATELAGDLNNLLANYQILYANVRGCHWNIKGRSFFELHAKFEEIYNDLVLKVDEIAERILTLGVVPVHGFSRYLEVSSIKETLNVTDGKEAVSHIIEAYSTLLTQQRKILAAAGELGDEGTASLMSDYISQQEKETWMLNAYLQ
jgi:starvation-inducible DNA-binding protein